MSYICDMKWLHNLLKGASLTTALFIFQACYGTAERLYLEDRGEASMSFTVTSRTSGEPLQGIRVSGSEDNDLSFLDLGTTGPDGRCSVQIPYYRNVRGPYIRFMDPSGYYEVKDTVLYDLRERDIEIRMNDAQ